VVVSVDEELLDSEEDTLVGSVAVLDSIDEALVDSKVDVMAVSVLLDSDVDVTATSVDEGLLDSEEDTLVRSEAVPVSVAEALVDSAMLVSEASVTVVPVLESVAERVFDIVVSGMTIIEESVLDWVDSEVRVIVIRVLASVDEAIVDSALDVVTGSKVVTSTVSITTVLLELVAGSDSDVLVDSELLVSAIVVLVSLDKALEL
jgi:hypothetical protein